jgi:predicted DNA-binding antitoxin AbrB/MazE fold protein
MSALKARVENGRIKLDQPTDLPNGTELYIVPAAELDDIVLLRDDGLDDEERKRLHESIRRGIADGRAGRVTDFDEFLTELEAER